MTESCCPAGSLPPLPKKDMGTDVYYAAPPPGTTSDRGIIIVYDVYGWTGRMPALVSDVAGKGFHVVCVDVFRGASIDDLGGFGNEEAMAWLKSRTESCVDDLKPAFDKLSAVGAKRIGSLGFCWGAYVVFKLSATGRLGAGVSCHPSLKIGDIFFKESEATQAAKVQCPQLLMPAGNDPDLYRDDSLKRIIMDAGYECRTRDFPEQQHGWVPRGDLSVPTVARDAQLALKEATDFFDEML